MSGKRTLTTTQALNDALFECLTNIMKVGASSKGNNFDETVRDKLKYHLDGAKYITTEQWSSKDKDSIFFEHNKETLKYKFDFTHLPTIIDNGRKLDLMIVDKPNGSQKWPDMLVVFNGIGLPIEIKSAKNDVILWNSGIPRADSLYIYNCYGKSKTTCFLGQHAINDDELQFLLLKSKMAKEFNERHISTKWDFYARDMFNSTQKFFENDDILKACLKHQENICEYESELNLLVGSINKKELDKIEKLNNNINGLTVIFNELDDKHKNQQKERLHTEYETLTYIKYLSWTQQQKTDFNLYVKPKLDDCHTLKPKM